jgi:hypothetical protein
LTFQLKPDSDFRRQSFIGSAQFCQVSAKLESEGVLVRVAASHGKGSAIRLVGATAA